MKKRLMVLSLLTALMATLLCGCMFSDLFSSGEEFTPKQGDAVVILAGRHANARMYTENQLKDTVLQKLDDCVTYYMDGEKYCADIHVYVLVTDGEPELVPITWKGQEVPLRYMRNDPVQLYDDVEDTKAILLEFLMSEELKADDEEVDLQAAIAEGATILRNADCVNRYMYIFDTGIVTKGYMDMQKLDIQNGTVDDVISRIHPGAFPNLDGIQVSFYGLGNVGLGQNDRFRKDDQVVNRLVNLWTAFFGMCVENGDYPLVNDIKLAPSEGLEMIYTEDGSTGYPRVSNVGFVIGENASAPEQESVPGTETLDTGIVIPTSELSFKPSSSQFHSEDDAMAALNSFAADFGKLQNNDDLIYVVGSIAQVDINYKQLTSDISRGRAEAVKELMVAKYGFDPERIIVIDAGTRKFTWRSAEEFPGGTQSSWNETNAQKNRVVAIIPASSDWVVELQNEGLVP